MLFLLSLKHLAPKSWCLKKSEILREIADCRSGAGKLKGESETLTVSDYLFNMEGKVGFTMEKSGRHHLNQVKITGNGILAPEPPALMQGENYHITLVVILPKCFTGI